MRNHLGILGIRAASGFPTLASADFVETVPTLTRLASLPSGDPADPNARPQGAVLGFTESSEDTYSGFDSGLETDDEPAAAGGAKRSAAATAEGDLMPLPVLLALLLLLAAGAAYAIVGRTRRSTASGPEAEPNIAMAAAAPPAVAPPPPAAPEAPAHVEAPAQVEAPPPPWHRPDDVFAEPAPEEPDDCRRACARARG